MPAEQPHSGYCPSCESTALVLLTDSKSAPILLKSVPDTGKPWWQNPEDGVPLLICFLFLFLVCLAPLFPFPSEVSLFQFYPFIPSPSEHKPSPSALLSLTCCCSKELLVSRLSLSGSCSFLSLLSREEEVKTSWISSLLLISPCVLLPGKKRIFGNQKKPKRIFSQIFRNQQKPGAAALYVLVNSLGCLTLPETSHGHSQSIPRIRISVTDT